MILRPTLLVAILAGLTVLLLSSPNGAFAHAEYESSTPAKNMVLQQAPEQVDVTFTEEVVRQGDSSSVRVFNEANDQVSEGSGEVNDADRTLITATLQPNLPAGLYIVRWTTISDPDGDSDEGAFCFYIQVQPTAAQQATCAAFEEEGATATAGGATATAANQPTPTSSSSNSGDDGGSNGAGIGAIVGVIIAVAVVGGGLFFWIRRSRA